MNVKVIACRTAGERRALVDLEIRPLGLRIHGSILVRDEASGGHWLQTIGTFPDEAHHRRFADEVVRQVALKWRLP